MTHLGQISPCVQVMPSDCIPIPSFPRRPVSSCLLSCPPRVKSIINGDSEGRGEVNHVAAKYQDRLGNRYEYVCLGKLLSLGHRD